MLLSLLVSFKLDSFPSSYLVKYCRFLVGNLPYAEYELVIYLMR